MKMLAIVTAMLVLMGLVILPAILDSQDSSEVRGGPSQGIVIDREPGNEYWPGYQVTDCSGACGCDPC